jgi:hypothetical protein
MKLISNRIHALLRGAPRVWFVAEYQVQAAEMVTPPPANELPGLVFYHQLDPDPEGIRFISYWESREEFEACRNPLERQIGAPKLLRAAWVRQITAQRKPFWKRVTLYGVLVHSIAVLGILTALEEYQVWLFEVPMVTLEVQAAEPSQLLEGSPLTTHLLLINQRANATARISNLRARLIGPSWSERLHLDSSPNLGKGGSLSLPLWTRPLRPGLYCLEVDGKSRSGLLVGQKTLHLRRQLRVWGRKPEVEISLINDRPLRSELRGLLRVGEEAPSGLDCFATVVKEPSLRFGPMEFRGMTDWPEPTVSRDGSVSNQSWSTPPIRAFSEVPFSLFLEGRPAAGWAFVTKRITVECTRSSGRDRP